MVAICRELLGLSVVEWCSVSCLSGGLSVKEGAAAFAATLFLSR